MRAAQKCYEVVIAVCCLAASMLAQTTTGRILDTVHDQSGAAITGASIVVTDVQRGGTRTTSTDESGNYLVPALPQIGRAHV